LNSKGILEMLLQSGQTLARQGQGAAERGLGVPGAGAERDAMMSGLGKGALAGGALALLLGSKGGRKIGGSALKLGSLAALGSMAYKAYQSWQAEQGQTATVAPGTPVDQLSGPPAEQRSMVLLRAMIAAAKADGHVDQTERAHIESALARLDVDADTLGFFQRELSGPADPKAIAALADSPEAAAEIYLTSRLAVDLDSAMERAYLEDLATHLRLDPELVTKLEAQASTPSTGR
jgi:uncharacterized membrane protein YebE (DUF533 family)